MTARRKSSQLQKVWQLQKCRASSSYSDLRRPPRRANRMRTSEQRQRLGLEQAALQQEGFSQFSVYWDKGDDTYYASGYTSSNSGRPYGLHISIPSGFPYERPPMYLTEPFPLLMHDGSRVSSLGLSHRMHTLAPHSNGMVQL